jgi:hypothetical protein
MERSSTARTAPRPDPAALHARAQQLALSGLAQGDELWDLESAVGKTDVRGFTPDVAMLELAAAALDAADATAAEPIEYEGLREQYLPELELRGKAEHRSSQYALYAAAAMRGGVQPDLLNDAGWWHTRLWRSPSMHS